MHVKLEVETQPFSNFWIKLRSLFKIAAFWLLVIFVNIAVTISAFAWLPDFLIKRRINPDIANISAYAVSIGFLVFCASTIWTALDHAKQEARWRNATD